ncbi:uncharacterized protein LOC115279969 isoform X2 [Suricata suricatta]|uniref:uncharacterized protein LOC115279969 isoform X2 n=1 Tax=Suricata suricatta TaxID=37032 RepID=UPI001155C2EB|nr:uncharacterized protein LOC115279969 isoform X2 [Suricata suricatta]
MTLKLYSVPPPSRQLWMARKGGGGESRGRRVVGKAAGLLRSLPAPPHQLSRQVPGTPKAVPPPSLLEPELRSWGGLPKSWPPCMEYLPTWRFSEKVKKFGSPRSAPKSEGSQENLTGTTPSLRSHGEVVSIWNSSKGAWPQIRGPQCPVPKFQPGASWGRGTKAGRGARAERGRVWRQFEAHLMAAQRAGGAPTGGCSRGAPGSRFRGSGLVPDSAQSPPGSRPIESGFLGGTWTGPGRVLRRLLPLEVWSGGPCGRKGVRRPVPGAPRRPAAGTMLLLLLYFSSLHFVPKFHSPHPQCPAP